MLPGGIQCCWRTPRMPARSPAQAALQVRRVLAKRVLGLGITIVTLHIDSSGMRLAGGRGLAASQC